MTNSCGLKESWETALAWEKWLFSSKFHENLFLLLLQSGSIKSRISSLCSRCSQGSISSFCGILKNSIFMGFMERLLCATPCSNGAIPGLCLEGFGIFPVRRLHSLSGICSKDFFLLSRWDFPGSVPACSSCPVEQIPVHDPALSLWIPAGIRFPLRASSLEQLIWDQKDTENLFPHPRKSENCGILEYLGGKGP